MSTETAWPPAWTLKPTEGDPHDAESLEICEGIGWDLSFGFRLNVAHDDAEDVNSPLTIGAHFSDADLARGFVQREVTPAQLEEFARLLLNLAAKHKRRLAWRTAVEAEFSCIKCGPIAAADIYLLNWESPHGDERCQRCGGGDLEIPRPAETPEATDE